MHNCPDVGAYNYCALCSKELPCPIVPLPPEPEAIDPIAVFRRCIEALQDATDGDDFEGYYTALVSLITKDRPIADESIIPALIAKGGYCPCMVGKVACPCEAKSKDGTTCHCGLFWLGE